MNYIWEMAVRLSEKGMGRDKIFYMQAAEYSPYYEQAFPCVNEDGLDDPAIEVNSMYRFEGIFGGLLSPGLKGDEQFKKYLFDILMHYLTEIDMLKGLSKKEFYVRKIRQNIEMGHYGQKTLGCFRQLDEDMQYAVCGHLLSQFQVGSSILLFSKALRDLFPNAVIYKNNNNKKQILVYIGQKKNNDASVKMELAEGMFLPIGYSIRMFYEYHFGILDVDETLILDNIEIF